MFFIDHFGANYDHTSGKKLFSVTIFNFSHSNLFVSLITYLPINLNNKRFDNFKILWSNILLEWKIDNWGHIYPENILVFSY